jgi:hypothetical protein
MVSYGHFRPPSPYICTVSNILKGIEIPAYIIGALTAGGGTFGYIKTGSVPSVVAGVTVGTLVYSHSISLPPNSG